MSPPPRNRGDLHGNGHGRSRTPISPSRSRSLSKSPEPGRYRWFRSRFLFKFSHFFLQVKLPFDSEAALRPLVTTNSFFLLKLLFASSLFNLPFVHLLQLLKFESPPDAFFRVASTSIDLILSHSGRQLCSSLSWFSFVSTKSVVTYVSGFEALESLLCIGYLPWWTQTRKNANWNLN